MLNQRIDNKKRLTLLFSQPLFYSIIKQYSVQKVAFIFVKH